MRFNTDTYKSKTVFGVPLPLLFSILLILLALSLRLIFSWLSMKNLPVSSDEASIVLHAKDIIRGKFPLLFMGQPLLFPVEAYLMAPFVEWLPRNAFGARSQTLILGALSTAGFLLITFKAFPKMERWPVILLILFPSAYFLLLTAAYAPPQYPTSLTLAWLSIYCVLRSRETANKSLLVLTGLASGLAVSNHLLSIPVCMGVLALIVFAGEAKRGFQGALLFAAGFGLGIIPYLLAIRFIPGAYQNLPAMLPLDVTFSELKKFVLTKSLTGAMGIYPTIFPDFSRAHLDWPKELRSAFAFSYILLFGILMLNRLWVFGKTALNRSWPTLLLVDAALIISLMTIFSFACHYTQPFSFRYLLHTVWCFPFLLGHAYLVCQNRGKNIIGAIAIILAVFNIVAAAATIKQWRKPRRLMPYTDIPPIESLLKELQARNITHCYASFWLAYRITFESDEKILCTMPFNERFAFWPYPYKTAVDQAPEAVYILTQTIASKLPALSFEDHLKNQGISYSKSKVGYEVGSFLIYDDFRYPRLQGEHLLNRKEYTLENEGTGERMSAARADGNTAKPAEAGQEYQTWLRVDFNKEQAVTLITLADLPFIANIGKKLRLSVYANDQWRILSGKEDYAFELLRFANNHPIYNDIPRQVRFTPIVINALKIEVADQNLKKPNKAPAINIYVDNHHGPIAQ